MEGKNEVESASITEEMIQGSITEGIRQDPELFGRVMEAKYLRACEKMEEGRRRFVLGNNKGAIKSYSEGIQCVHFDNTQDLGRSSLKPKLLEVFKALLEDIGQTFIASERWDEGLEVCERCIKLDLSDLKTYYQAGMCLKKIGKLNESFARLEEGSKLAQSYNMDLDDQYKSLKGNVEEELKQLKQAANAQPTPNQKEKKMGCKTRFFMFTILSGFGGTAAFVGLSRHPLTKGLSERHRMAAACGLGTGFGAMATSEGWGYRILGGIIVLSAAGFVAFKLELIPQLAKFLPK